MIWPCVPPGQYRVCEPPASAGFPRRARIPAKASYGNPRVPGRQCARRLVFAYRAMYIAFYAKVFTAAVAAAAAVEIAG